MRDYLEFAGEIDEWQPSSDIAAAWKVVEKMRGDGYRIQLFPHDCQVYCDDKIYIAKNKVRITTPNYVTHEVGDDNIFLAICRAALLAILETNP